MKRLWVFIQKEAYHILRDRRSLLILIGMPIVQIVLFGFAITNEVKNAPIAILDYAKDEATQTITQQLEASRYFDIVLNAKTEAEAEAAFKQAKTKLLIIFPSSFRSQLLHQNQAQVRLVADAADPNEATTLINYAQVILMDYQTSLSPTAMANLPMQIKVETRMLYNPQLKGAYNFVPGVMAMVFMLICAMMTSVAIVREKELGTMEILLVSPVRSGMTIFSKVVPYFLLSTVNLASILLLAVFALEMPIQGSLGLLLFSCLLYIFTALSLGILISTAADTQQTAMMISMTALLLPIIMLSGFMFPIENMPLPMQVLSNLIPAKWFIILIKDVMIKGAGLEAVWKELGILALMTVFLITVSIRKLKIRLE